MPTSNSSSCKGRKISLPLYLPSNSRSWRDEESSIVGQNTTVEYCPSGRQIHSPQDWHSRGKARKIFLALPESPHICRALHSPRGISGAVFICGVITRLRALHQERPP